MVNRVRSLAAIAVLVGMALTGCGYTTKAKVLDTVRTVYIAPVKNTIDLSGEIGDNANFRVYRPGLEVELTNAIINRFIFDGNLKVASAETADAVVEAKLVDYRRDPLRYTDGDDVQEYRLNITIEAVVYTKPDRKVLWRDGITGDTSYILSGPLSKTEDEAAALAVEDTARRVVEKTMESW